MMLANKLDTQFTRIELDRESLAAAASLVQLLLQQTPEPAPARGARATGRTAGEPVYQLSDGWIFAHSLDRRLKIPHGAQQGRARHERHERGHDAIAQARHLDPLVGPPGLISHARDGHRRVGVLAWLSRTLPVPARSRNLLTVGPGHRQLTLTPVSRASSHSASEKDNTNALEA